MNDSFDQSHQGSFSMYWLGSGLQKCMIIASIIPDGQFCNTSGWAILNVS